MLLGSCPNARGAAQSTRLTAYGSTATTVEWLHPADGAFDIVHRQANPLAYAKGPSRNSPFSVRVKPGRKARAVAGFQAVDARTLSVWPRAYTRSGANRGASMKMRYRMPSTKTLLGVTTVKRQVKKNLGVYEVTRVLNAPKNTKRKLKRAAGWESEPFKLFRFLRRLFK